MGEGKEKKKKEKKRNLAGVTISRQISACYRKVSYHMFQLRR